ncbi:Uncharacterised protein [Citrobacter koseri]|nr:Uncharacterised protein [Citrobacter koseri]
MLPPKVITALRFWLIPATVHYLQFISQKIGKSAERHIKIIRHRKMQTPPEKPYCPEKSSFGRFAGGSIKTLNVSSSCA